MPQAVVGGLTFVLSIVEDVTFLALIGATLWYFFMHD